jgi:predicted 3-demethylubiquinone-9 3-methyltransferase (glyoxalase superfamily)
MNSSIHPCLCLIGKIAEATDFYIHVFGEGRITQKSDLVIVLELSGQKFMLLNDGLQSKPNPAVSFMVTSETEEETELYWNKLIKEGMSLMPLDAYDWSKKYGWVQDKYGVSWQLYTGSRQDTPQKFCPTLMFTAASAGRAAEAVRFYTQLYPNSRIEGMLNYGENDHDKPSLIKHAQFKIKDYTMMAMDSSAKHGFAFNEAISLVVECDTQAEIDRYWDKLSDNGGQEVACGWVTDKFGLSWQIIPAQLIDLMKEPERAKRVLNKVMQMKKLITAELENA